MTSTTPHRTATAIAGGVVCMAVAALISGVLVGAAGTADALRPIAPVSGSAPLRAAGAPDPAAAAQRPQPSQVPAPTPIYVVPPAIAGEIDAEQAQNAIAIVKAARKMYPSDWRIQQHAAIVAVTAALQESSLVNLPEGDRDSVGLFQQRPSYDWGTAEQLTDPVYATTAFLHALDDIPDWRAKPIGDVVQQIQNSATPDAYADRVGLARSIVYALYTSGQVPNTQ